MRVLRRGGNWNNGANARTGLIVNTNNSPTNTNYNIGFRADLSCRRKRPPHGAAVSAKIQGNPTSLSVHSFSGPAK